MAEDIIIESDSKKFAKNILKYEDYSRNGFYNIKPTRKVSDKKNHSKSFRGIVLSEGSTHDQIWSDLTFKIDQVRREIRSCGGLPSS